MVYLGDYIGQLLAELTTARMRSDAESVRVAELYACHELLRHFPVPRIRVSQVEMSVSVSVIRIEAPPQGHSTSPTSPLQLLKQFGPLLSDHLHVHGIVLTETEAQTVNGRLQNVAERLFRPTEVAADTNTIADHFANTVRAALERFESHRDRAKSLSDQLRAAARVEFLNSRPDRPRLVVGVTTAEVKESPPESLVRISLRVTEEGIEWTNVADEANPDLRLVPE